MRSNGFRSCWNLISALLVCTVCVSCSTVSRLPEGELLYTGVRKVDVVDAVYAPLRDEAVGKARVAFVSPPNNAFFGSSRYRTPFPLGLWAYNAFAEDSTGLRRWLFKTFAVAPILVSTVNPALRAEVASNTLRVAGDAFDAAIVSYMKVRHSVLIGEATAELLKMRIGSAHPRYDRGELQVWGRSLRNGLAACITVQSGEIREAITEQLELIAASVKAALEETPPELSADIFDTGIMLTGGCSLIPGLPQLLEDSTGIRVRLSKHPFDSVCMGIGRCVETSDSSEFIRKRR